MGYQILEENLPKALHNKSRCMFCLLFTSAVLVITLSAVTVGVFFGYTYCYIEHRVGFRTGPLQSASIEILRIPYPDNEEAKNNRTIIHGALSKIIVSKILRVAPLLNKTEGVPLSEVYNKSESKE